MPSLQGPTGGVACPLCGGSTIRTTIELPDGTSGRHHPRMYGGLHCNRCGYATCDYQGAYVSWSGGANSEPLGHVHLHVPKALREFVRWVPSGGGVRPWRTGRQPWWPKGVHTDIGNLSIQILPEVRNGRLRWYRSDYMVMGIGQLRIKLPVTYPTFAAALGASAEENEAIGEVAKKPPRIMLLKRKRLAHRR